MDSKCSSLQCKGFSGRVVNRGMGVKPVVVYDSGSHFFFAEREGSARYTEAEVIEMEKRCLLTITPTTASYNFPMVVLYAHREFLYPASPPGSLFLDTESTFSRYRSADFLYRFCSPEEAREVSSAWGCTLRSHAYRVLRYGLLTPMERGQIVKGESRRIRFTVAGQNRPEAQALRKDALFLSLVGDALCEQNSDRLRDLAITDGFDEIVVEEIGKRARKVVREILDGSG